MRAVSPKTSAVVAAPVQSGSGVDTEESKKELLLRLNNALAVIRDEEAFIQNQQSQSYVDRSRRLTRILNEMIVEQVRSFQGSASNDRSEK